MKKIYFTRLTGLILLAGFFYSCATTSANVNELIRNQEYTIALNALDEQMTQDPEDPELYLQRAEVATLLAQQLQPEERLDLYSQAIEDIQSASEYGASDSQLESSDSLLQQTWKEEHNAGLQASEEENQNSLDLAVTHFQNAITLRPDAVSSYQNLAVVLFDQGNVDAAIQSLMDALNEIENPPVSIYENLGYLYLEKGNPAESVHYYELANKNVEEDLNLTFGLVNAYIAEGNSVQASELLEPLIRQNPADPDLRNVYGTQLYNITANILEDLKSAYEDQDSAFVEQLRLEAEGMGEEAENQLQEAFKRDTTHAGYIESLAVFYNNLAGQYFTVADVAFEAHQQQLQQKALTLVDFAIDYYSRLESIEPSNNEFKNKLNSLRRLKENRSVDSQQ